jgi:hypothetical protein
MSSWGYHIDMSHSFRVSECASPHVVQPLLTVVAKIEEQDRHVSLPLRLKTTWEINRTKILKPMLASPLDPLGPGHGGPVRPLFSIIKSRVPVGLQSRQLSVNNVQGARRSVEKQTSTRPPQDLHKISGHDFAL